MPDKVVAGTSAKYTERERERDPAVSTLTRIDSHPFQFQFAHYTLTVGDDVKQTRGTNLY